MRKIRIAFFVVALSLIPMVSFSGSWNGTIYTLVPTSSTTVTGATQNLDFPYDKHTWCTTIAGASSVSVTFQGSLDSTLWVTLDTSTSATSECRHVVNKPVKYVRAVIGTLDAGTLKVNSLHMN